MTLSDTFNINNIKKNANFLIIGDEERPKQGKTTLALDIMNTLLNKYDIYDGNIIVPNDISIYYPEYSSFIIDKQLDNYKIYEKYDDNIITNIINHQKEYKDDSLMLIDDYDNLNYYNHPTVKEIITENVNYNISNIFVNSKTMNIDTNLCYFFDYIFLFRQRGLSNKYRLYNQLEQSFKNFVDFNVHLDSLNNLKHECMVIDNTVNLESDSSNIHSDKIFKYVANYNEKYERYDINNNAYFNNECFNIIKENKEQEQEQDINEFELIDGDGDSDSDDNEDDNGDMNKDENNNENCVIC
jgi:hypothetical protein